MDKKISKASRPNIILFLYDSLIAPMLSSFGGTAPTPAFDFFANGGAQFKKTAAHSLRSDVALGTILTGCYPHHNGIHKLITENHASATNLGYLYEDENSLILSGYWSGYRVRIFNCGELNQCTKKTLTHNFPVTAPHMDQLMHFVNESKDGPFLLVDRFNTTGFGWHHAQTKDRRDSDAEQRELAMRGLESPKSRSLIIRRMENTIMREDERLMRVINLLHRHSLMDKTVVVIAGMPGDVNKKEKDALNRLGGYKEGSALFSPTIVWCPEKIKPSFSEKAMIRHIDIAPTLTSLAGIKTSYKMDGRDIFAASDSKNSPIDETLTFYDNSIELDSNGHGSTMSIAGAESDGNGDNQADANPRLLELLDSPSTIPKRSDVLLDDNVILKSTIFILGIPRSGTTFFSKFFQKEEFSNVECRGHHAPLPLNEINVLYDSGILDKETAKKSITKLRPEIISSNKETLVVVSHDCYAIVELLAEVFVNSKFILITREPRTFITSLASFPDNVRYIKTDSFHTGHLIMQPWRRCKDQQGWVERLSYTWNDFTKKYRDGIQNLGERGLIVRFEDVFDSAKGYPGMKKIARFIKNEVGIPDNDSWLESALRKKVNSFAYAYPEWKEWSKKDKEAVIRLCGKTMSMLGYDPDADP